MNTDQTNHLQQFKHGLAISAHQCLPAIVLAKAGRSVAKSLWFAGLLSVVCGPLHAQNQTINGNLTVTGSIEAAGPIDSGDNTLTFGTQGSGFGGALLYQDNSVDTFTFNANRNPASWLWQHSAAVAAMRLDSAHQLILYKSDGTTAGVTLAPASNSIKLGTHANGTLTADANGVITAGGGFAVAGGITNTNGTLTGGTTGLTLNAGGTNQNITLNSSGGDLIFSTNSAERMRIKFTGNVGIGMSSPSRKLSVQGDGLFTDGQRGSWIGHDGYAGGRAFLVLDMDSQDGVGSGGDYIYLAQDTGQGTLASASGTPLRLGSGGGGHVTISTEGNVGIGTTSPGTKLDVGGPTGSQYGTLCLKQSAAGQKGIWLQAYENNNALSLFHTGSLAVITSDYTISGNHVPLALQSTGGNVGIGTSSPAARLAVVGTSTMDPLQLKDANGNSFRIGPGVGVAGGFQFHDDIAAATRLRIDNAGNVGIGTTAPVAKLHVSSKDGNGNAYNAISIGSSPNSGMSGSSELNFVGYGTTGDGAYIDYSRNNGRGLKFRSVETDSAGNESGHAHVMVLTSSGNVGIGTTSPVAKVHLFGADDNARGQFSVESSGNDARISFYNANGATATGRGDILMSRSTGYEGLRFMINNSDKMIIDESGNVGIGTPSPTHKLSVKGAIRAQEIIVDNTNWADYVFEEGYRLAPLTEVESHIKAKKHLPGIPSATEVAEHGVSMGEMQAKLLSKVEELTLHLIAQEKEIAALKTQNASFQEQLAHIKATQP